MLLASASVLGQFGITVRARWADLAEERCTGHVPVLADAKAGSTVMVWVDGSSQLPGLPLQALSLTLSVILVAVA